MSSSSASGPSWSGQLRPDEDSGSNRFTLTDYVYDREDAPARLDASTGPSNTARAYRQPISLAPPLPPSSIPPGAAFSHTFEEDRPSSWGLAVNSQIAHIRGSTIGPSPLTNPSSRDGGAIVYPPTARTSDKMNPLPSPPQTSPSDNMAIHRLPPIPVPPPNSAQADPRGYWNPTSPHPDSNHARPTLPATVSSTSLASSHPSPSLLPAFQLTSKMNGSRPSLMSMPSSSSAGGYKGREGGTEMSHMPSLAWEEEDANKSVMFVGLTEKGREGEEEKDSQGLRFRGNKSEKKVRMLDWIFPDSVYCRLLLGTVVFELVVDLVIEANILWRFNTEVNSSAPTASMLENKRRLPIFLIIFGLAHLWQLLLTIIAIRTKNTIQISAITIFNFAFLAWAVIQVSELRQILGDLQTSLIDDAIEAGGAAAASKSRNLLNLPLNVLTAVIIGVVATCCLVLSVLAYFVQREFGWERYRFLGADLQIRSYYRRFQVFECLVYFTAFFAAGFGIQFLWLVLARTDAEYIITWAMFPVSLVFLVFGRFAAKYENKPFMIFFVAGLTLGQAYFIFKLVRIWQLSSTVYLNVSKSLTVFNALSLLCLTACLVCSILVFRDFGKGLKGAVLSQHSRSPRVGFNRWRSGEEDAASSAAQKRLSID